MKIFGGFYLWIIIGVLFFRWAGRAASNDGNRNRVAIDDDDDSMRVPEDLTYGLARRSRSSGRRVVKSCQVARILTSNPTEKARGVALLARLPCWPCSTCDASVPNPTLYAMRFAARRGPISVRWMR